MDEEAEKLKQKWLDIERARQKREQFEIKDFSGWMFTGPILGILVAGLAGLMIWLGGGGQANSWLWWLVGIGLAPMMLMGIASDLEKEWRASKAAKSELGHPTHDYKYDHLYTDKVWYYYLYAVGRFVGVLSTIVFGLMAAILLFMWFGTMSIAPTTIIIILLVMILLKEK